MSDSRSAPFIIGLTGNIATGKSVVLAQAARRGALTIDADKVTHHVLSNSDQVIAAIEEQLGGEVLDQDGAIDRSALGQLVFADQSLMRKLESIVHPHVRSRIMMLLNDSSAKVVVIEAIKLLESPLVELCGAIWVTSCRLDQQIKRLVKIRHLDPESARSRVEGQSSQLLKIARADVVIDTSGSIETTLRQFDLAWEGLFGAEEEAKREQA